MEIATPASKEKEIISKFLSSRGTIVLAIDADGNLSLQQRNFEGNNVLRYFTAFLYLGSIDLVHTGYDPTAIEFTEAIHNLIQRKRKALAGAA